MGTKTPLVMSTLVLIQDPHSKQAENLHHTQPKRQKSNNGQNPVRLVIRAPPIPKEGYWPKQPEEYTRRQAHFGLKDAIVRFGEAQNGCVGCTRYEDDGEEEANSDAEVG